jgi:hypothetical protein
MDGNSAPSTTLFRIPLYVHLVATASMGLLTLFLREKWFVYAMFLVFEGTTGVFYPSYGMIKSEKIPEDIRSAVMNILRIPLNIFVVLLLLKFKYLSSSTVLSVCTAAHAIAFFAYFYFYTTPPLTTTNPNSTCTHETTQRPINHRMHSISRILQHPPPLHQAVLTSHHHKKYSEISQRPTKSTNIPLRHLIRKMCSTKHQVSHSIRGRQEKEASNPKPPTG